MDVNSTVTQTDGFLSLWRLKYFIFSPKVFDGLYLADLAHIASTNIS